MRIFVDLGRMAPRDTEKLKGDIKGEAKDFWFEMEISWLELNMKISPNRVQNFGSFFRIKSFHALKFRFLISLETFHAFRALFFITKHY